jgi:hypothetical protein
MNHQNHTVMNRIIWTLLFFFSLGFALAQETPAKEEKPSETTEKPKEVKSVPVADKKRRPLRILSAPRPGSLPITAPVPSGTPSSPTTTPQNPRTNVPPAPPTKGKPGGN